VFAAQSLAGAGPDLYGRGLPHNLRLYVSPEDNRVLAFPWDWDLSVMGIATNADIFPSGNIRKVIDIPANKRAFYSHLHELAATTFNRAYMTYWVNHYSSLLPGQNFSGALGYLDARNAFVASQLPAVVPFSATTGDVVNATTLLAADAPVRALVPYTTNGGDLLGTTWTQTGFVDDGWIAGTKGIGYERTGGYEGLYGLDVLSAIDPNGDDINDNNSVFVRATFDVAGGASFDRLKLRMMYDDGFVAYLNGVKVAEANAPASPAWNSEATTTHDDTLAAVFAEFDITQHLALLQPGQNVLAVHSLNRGNGSSDMLMVPEIVAETTESGADSIVTDGPTVTLGGSAWINARQIRVQGQTAPLVLSWPTVTTWQATIPVDFGTHVLTLEAVDYRGVVVGSDTISVTSTHSDRPLEDFLRITEVMFHPPEVNEAEALFGDREEFEYLELTNTSMDRTLDLTGVRITGGIDFDFTGSTHATLAPGEHVVVAKNLDAFAARYPAAASRATGPYAGRLNNAGEQLQLVESNDIVILDFTYDDAEPWWPTTDGDGHSLVIRDASADPATWGDAASWRPSIYVGGSPGQPDLLVGDLDGDHRVALSDLAILARNTGTTSTTRARGDLSGDGAVTRIDLALLAPNYGATYTPPPPTMPGPSPTAGADSTTLTARRRPKMSPTAVDATIAGATESDTIRPVRARRR
jgi:hypothetical protein